MIDKLQKTSFDDIYPSKDYAKKHSKILSESQVNWLVKTRHKNGLAETGAVLKISGKIYLIDHLFLGWFLNQKAS